MQNRMKLYPLSEKEQKILLESVQVASLAMVSPEGTPYVLPVHYVYLENKIYFHGLPKGRKLVYIRQNPAVALTLYEMEELLYPKEQTPCDVNTKYRSLAILGEAYLVEEEKEKEAALHGIVKKYAPELAEAPMPKKAVEATAVVGIEIREMTGKYYE